MLDFETFYFFTKISLLTNNFLLELFQVNFFPKIKIIQPRRKLKKKSNFGKKNWVRLEFDPSEDFLSYREKRDTSHYLERNFFYRIAY